MLRYVSEKLNAKLLAARRGYSMEKFARLDDASSEVFEWEVRPVEGQSLQQNDKKRRKEKVNRKKKE